MSGTFYVIGTPIGNLEDITLRQLDTLAAVDFICAEDTRVTLKLLNRFDIKKQLISFHEHSSKADAQRIIDRLLAGESCGIVTDAGMPCISDPGEVLVRLCAEQGIDIKVVPGPSAVVSRDFFPFRKRREPSALKSSAARLRSWCSMKLHTS